MLRFQKSSFQPPVKESSSIRRENILEAEVPVLWPVAQPEVGPGARVPGVEWSSRVLPAFHHCLYLSDHLLDLPLGLSARSPPAAGNTPTAGNPTQVLQCVHDKKIKPGGRFSAFSLTRCCSFKKCSTPAHSHAS